MSFVKMERRPAEWWQGQAETAAQMQERHWDVTSECPDCRLTMRVDLAVVIAVAGLEVSMWNRRQPCRRLGCAGVVRFLARPPELQRPFPLEANWPDERAPVARQRRQRS